MCFEGVDGLLELGGARFGGRVVEECWWDGDEYGWEEGFERGYVVLKIGVGWW